MTGEKNGFPEAATLSGFAQKLLRILGFRVKGPNAPGQSERDTRPATPRVDRPNTAERSLPAQWQVGIGYSTGRQRQHNEDTAFALTANLLSNATSIPFGLYIVADGMGGHQHGEVASSAAVRTMANYVIEKLYSKIFYQPDSGQIDSIQQIMRDGIQAAHQAIIRQVQGGGTTLTALLLLEDSMTLAHVGDSRAYTVSPAGQLNLLTRDHSLVKRLVELGQISSEEAAVHPQRNVLYRALGQGEPVNAEVISMPIPADGHLLLCSDGLWGVLSEGDLLKIITASNDPVQTCQSLIQAANEAGGPDNITAILIRLPA